MTIPTFFDAGAGNSTTGTSLTAAYPASVANGDIAIGHAVVRAAAGSGALDLTWPGDWGEVSDVYVSGTNGSLNSAWAWKRLDGTETGSISIGGAPGGGVGSFARMYVFRGCVASGTPYEAATTTSGTVSTTYSSSAITTLGTDRLAVCLICISDDDKTIAGMTGSNVTWAESIAEFASGTGADCTLSCQQANVAAATSITAGSESYTGSETWRTHTFALLPVVEVYVPRYGYVNYVDPGVL